MQAKSGMTPFAASKTIEIHTSTSVFLRTVCSSVKIHIRIHTATQAKCCQQYPGVHNLFFAQCNGVNQES